MNITASVNRYFATKSKYTFHFRHQKENWKNAIQCLPSNKCSMKWDSNRSWGKFPQFSFWTSWAASPASRRFCPGATRRPALPPAFWVSIFVKTCSIDYYFTHTNCPNNFRRNGECGPLHKIGVHGGAPQDQGGPSEGGAKLRRSVDHGREPEPDTRRAVSPGMQEGRSPFRLGKTNRFSPIIVWWFRD